MIAHAKLIIIANAINGDWVPDWSDWSQNKYSPWFNMDDGFSSDGYADWSAGSSVSSRLCFESREKAEYVGRQFQELYKIYFIKS